MFLAVTGSEGAIAGELVEAAELVEVLDQLVEVLDDVVEDLVEDLDGRLAARGHPVQLAHAGGEHGDQLADGVVKFPERIR